MAPGTRDRILVAAGELFRRKGYAGTGPKEVVTETEAPFGSLCLHFPGGKEQLGSEVIGTAGAMYGMLVAAVPAAHDDLVAGVREFFRLAGRRLEESGWPDACPIAAIAVEVASVNEPLRRATRDAFDGWIAHGTRFLEDGGLDGATARRLAIALIAALEGAFILARAARTVEPLDQAGEVIAAEVERALAAHRVAG
jgi:AcrR family transcriptional regulator